MVNVLQKQQKPDLVPVLSSFFLVGAAILAIVVQGHLLYYFYFDDEGETVVAAKMMAAGYRLYSEIFNHHGPLTFLPQYVLEKLGFGGFVMGRVLIFCLQWMALVAVYFSPLMRDCLSRNAVVIVVGAVMVVYLPDMFGHSMQYHVLAGLVLMVVMSQFILPTIAGMPLAQWRVAGGSFLIASLPFLAVTYAPMAGLVWFSTLRRQELRTMVLAALAAVILNLLFLGLTGSLSGYWAAHFYMNSAILQAYASGSPTPVGMLTTAFLVPSSSFGSFAGLCLGLIVAGVLAQREGGRFHWRTMLLFLGLVSTLIRGIGPEGMRALPMVYALLAGLAIFFGNPATMRRALPIATIGVLLCIGRLWVAAYQQDQKYVGKPQLLPTPFGELAKAVTSPTDRIISYSFSNYEYLAADRLPASAQYFYLPWQADYEKNPVLGVNLNACRDIEQHRPKLIKLTRWNVGGRYPWENYGGCVEAIVARSYRPVPGIEGAYIRNDVQLPGDSAKVLESARGG